MFSWDLSKKYEKFDRLGYSTYLLKGILEVIELCKLIG